MSDTVNFLVGGGGNVDGYSLVAYPDSRYGTVMISASGSGLWNMTLNINNSNSMTHAGKIPLVTGTGQVMYKYVYGQCIFESTCTALTNNKHFIVCVASDANDANQSIELMYNLTLPTFSGSTTNPPGIVTGNSTFQTSISNTNTTWYSPSTSSNFATTCNLALYKFSASSSYLFFTLKNGYIGKLTITDSTTSTLPTAGSANENFITPTMTGADLTGTTGYIKYPTGLTIDSNGLLYTVLGHDSVKLTVDTFIKVFDITGTTPISKYFITYPSTIYLSSTGGYPYSLCWYNNILYVGTHNLFFTTGTTGSIFKYNTLYASSNNVPTRNTFRASTKSVGGMVVINNYLYTTSINTAASPGAVAIDKYTLKYNNTNFNFNLNGNYIDIANIFKTTDTTTANNLGAGCNYFINDSANNLNTLYLNNSTNNKLNLNTNYYILVGSQYYDISIFFDRNENIEPSFTSGSALTPLSVSTKGRLFYYIKNNTISAITNSITMPFTRTAYIICIGGGGNGSSGTGGSGGGFVYTEAPLVGGTKYNISVGGIAAATTFSIDGTPPTVVISAGGGGSNTISGGTTSVTISNSTNTITQNGNTGSGINGGLNILNLNINSDFINDMRSNSTTSGSSYDNNIAIGCGAYGTNNDNAVNINTLGDSLIGTSASSIYASNPTSGITGTGTGNGGGGTGSTINSGGGGIIYIYIFEY